MLLRYLFVSLFWIISPYAMSQQDTTQPDPLDLTPAEKVHDRALDAFFDDDFALALALVEQVIALDSNFHEIYQLRGQIRRALGNDASALEDFERFRQRYPQSKEPYKEIAQTHLENQAYEKAYATYTQGLEKLPQEAAFFYAERAEVAEKMNQYEKALADYEKALIIEPNDRGNLIGKSICLDKLRRKEESLATLLHIHELHPQNNSNYELIANAYSIHFKNYPQAFKYACKGVLLSKDPQEKKSIQATLRLITADWMSTISDYLGTLAGKKLGSTEELAHLYWNEMYALLEEIKPEKNPIPYEFVNKMIEFIRDDIKNPYRNADQTFYWEVPQYQKARQYYKNQQWALARAAFAELQKTFPQEEIVVQAIWFCDALLGKLVLTKEAPDDGMD